jgi:hypothetical protein
VQYQCLNVDGSEDPAHVDGRVHVEQLPSRPRARTHALQPAPPAAQRGVLPSAGGPGRHRGPLPPVRDLAVEQLRQQDRVDPERVVRGHGEPRCGAVEHKGLRPLGVLGREEHRHRAALRDPEDGRPLRACRVHDRPEVVYPLLERGWTGDRIRQARAPLVEEHQPAERGQSLQEPLQARFLPRPVEVGDEARRHHEVHVARAHDLVGDGQVAAAGVPGRRRHESVWHPRRRPVAVRWRRSGAPRFCASRRLLRIPDDDGPHCPYAAGAVVGTVDQLRAAVPV